MADNTTLNAGSGGDTFSTDDIGGIKHQRVKVEWGADGVANETDDASGKRLPVKVSEIAGAGSLFSGQQAVTASAVALPSNAARRVTVKALMGNVIPVFVGPSGITISTGFELAPNQSIVLDVSNSNLLFVIASTTGASVSFVGYP